MAKAFTVVLQKVMGEAREAVGRFRTGWFECFWWVLGYRGGPWLVPALG